MRSITIAWPTVAWLTLRGTAGRKRALLFALAPLILLLLALLMRATAPAGSHWPERVLGQFGFSVLLQLTALIIGTSVLGAEIDDGSAIHLLATPVSRGTIVRTKFAVAAGLTAAFAAVPEFVAGLLAGRGAGFAVSLFAGALAGSVIYCALFVLLSALTPRAIVYGLLYVLLWEGLLSNLVGGARLLSVSHYALAIAGVQGLNAGLSLVTAVTLGTIVTLGAVILAVRTLSAFSLKGEPVLPNGRVPSHESPASPLSRDPAPPRPAPGRLHV
jgi:ABC-2 type transport system permease protein